jgi:hypothetical protein
MRPTSASPSPSEGGGNRLTETGLSPAPQYMSPEQATGDRLLMPSDVTPSPPCSMRCCRRAARSGPNAQAMIAKLMTERPVHLRIVRGAVPENIDAAVARALDKTPADRFASAGDFSRALELKPITGTVPVAVATGAAATAKPKRGLWIGLAAAALVAAVAGAFAMKGKAPAAPRVESFALRDRTQLTTSGNVFVSAISADGKQLAYITHNCGTNGCSFAVDIQDVGGTATHRILDDITAGYGLEWSPDRRNLIFVGTWQGRYGYYLLSALGGTPRFLTPGAAMFYAGGDSLLVGPAGPSADSSFQVKVTSIDGTVRDSIRVAGPGLSLDGLSVSPGGKWIVALVVQSGRGFWQVFDRSGKVADHVLNSCTCPGRITSDALWLTRAGQGFESIIRLGIDPATGKLASRQDTLLSGNFNNFSVTADGSTLVVDDGSSDFSLWALGFQNALAGKFTDADRRARSSSRILSALSPDGGRILIARDVASSTGQAGRRYTVQPFAGGPEAPLNTAAGTRSSRWVDSVTVEFGTQVEGGVKVSLMDVRTGSVSRTVNLPDSLVRDVVPLPDGWAWVPSTSDRLVVRQRR